MTTVHHYKSNLRDLFFNLFEVLDLEGTSLAAERYSALDGETVRTTLQAMAKLAETTLAESFAEGDRGGLRFDPATGDVTIPDAVKRALKTYYDDEWHLLELPEHLGGYGAPPTVIWAASELLLGANPVLSFYLLGLLNARIIDRLGTESQKQRYCAHIVERRWGGTMVLTEPDAGSDVGAGRTKARHVEGDVWEIEGVKRFITNGDFDGVENIVHLVLARPEGAAPGTKGLSMFIVPKFWVHEDGTLGERNGAFCTGIEHKMGILASSTCEMTFGDRMPCRGLLVGEVHQGIRQMFQVIESARMAIGVKAASTLSTGYLNSLAYARERVQGPDLLQAQDKTAPRVPIIRHPDVRRMLMLQKSFAEGLRALYLFNAHTQDRVELAGGHASAEAIVDDKLNDLILPIIKGYASEKAYELLATSLQVYGGSGYCSDYPIEQYIRDAKIDTVYEGTTHIQALDLFFRKIARDGGQTLRALLGQVQATLAAEEGGAELAAERQALAEALGHVQAIFMTMLRKVQESLYHAGLQGNRILTAMGELLVGWLLIRHAAVAAAALPTATGDDVAFYQGKIASARFFCQTILPNLGVARRLVEGSSLGLMELPDEAF